jgi:hypothetical protein
MAVAFEVLSDAKPMPFPGEEIAEAGGIPRSVTHAGEEVSSLSGADLDREGGFI